MSLVDARLPPADPARFGGGFRAKREDAINLTTVVAACDVQLTCQRFTFAAGTCRPNAATVDTLRLSVSSLGLPSVHLRASRYGGQPSRGLPTVAHALVGERERRVVDQTGVEPVTS
jgi:hypothetical protein